MLLVLQRCVTVVPPFSELSADSCSTGRSRDGLYEPVLADSEREAVADLLQYLENVRTTYTAAEWNEYSPINSVEKPTSFPANLCVH